MITLNVTPGDEWDLKIEDCPKCSSPVTVTDEGDDDYMVVCGTCKFSFTVASEDGETGIVFDVLDPAKPCGCT